MESGELAEEINRHILDWSKKTQKLVVAIDGYTGIGKTTLINILLKLNSNIVTVNRDDFLVSREVQESLFKNAEDRSEVFELHNTRHKDIEDLIHRYKTSDEVFKTKVFNEKTGQIDVIKTFDLSKPVLVIEGVFMFHQKLLNNLWDKRVYLDGDTNAIDERRVKREKERWGNEYFPETHPDSYFKHVIIALKKYRETYKPEIQADVVLKVK